MVCGLPSSCSTKSSLVRLETRWLSLSRTVANRLTTLTSEVNVGFCASGWAGGAAGWLCCATSSLAAGNMGKRASRRRLEIEIGMAKLQAMDAPPPHLVTRTNTRDLCPPNFAGARLYGTVRNCPGTAAWRAVSSRGYDRPRAARAAGYRARRTGGPAAKA